MMISATSRPLWGFLCAALLSLGPLVTPAQAAQWYSGWGYGTYYRAPYSYTAGYGGYGYTAGYRYTAGYGYGGGCGYGGCCLTSLFHGCGLFGCYRPTYASYYAPSYASSACGPCGSGCSSCDPCGNVCIGGNCPTGDCGIESSPSPSTYSAEPAPNSPGSQGSSAPSTYREENMTNPSDQWVMPKEGPEEEDTQSDPGGVNIERGSPWESNKPPVPTEAEPDAAESLNVDEDAAQPLNLEVQLVYRLQPQRSRAHYRAVFRAPLVARTEVPAKSEWTPIKTDPQLASSN